MNNKVDEYGNIYLFMTRKEMGENLKVSSKTVIKIFKELEEANLIKQENQGKGKAYKIYVVDPSAFSDTGRSLTDTSTR